MKIGFDSKEIDEDNTSVTFPITFTSEGVYNEGLRTAAEMERIAPLTANIPIIVDHPPTPDVPATAVIYGHIIEPIVDVKNGLKVIRGKAKISKKYPDLIRKIKSEENSEVSMGYWYDTQYGGGDYNGAKYTHTRTKINPTHVAILVDMLPAACPPNQCNIGLDTNTSTGTATGYEELLITPKATKSTDFGQERKVNMQDNNTPPYGSSNEGCIMTDENKPKGKQPDIITTPEKKVAIMDIGLDTLIRENPCVKKLSDANNVMTDKLAKAEAGLDKLQEAVKTLTPYKEEADKRELEEVLVLRSEVQSAKVYPDEEVQAMGRDMLEVVLKALKSNKTIAQPKIPHPGSDSQPMPQTGLTVGIPKRDENGKVTWIR